MAPYDQRYGWGERLTTENHLYFWREWQQVNICNDRFETLTPSKQGISWVRDWRHMRYEHGYCLGERLKLSN